MDDRERIRLLEEQVAQLAEQKRKLLDQVAALSEDKRAGLSALETAANLGAFSAELAGRDDPTAILTECARRVRTLAPFPILGFFLAGDDMDFSLALADPPGSADQLRKEIEALIQDRTFGWALRRNRPLVVTARSGKERLLLHALTASSGPVGMFLGVLGRDREGLPDVALSLLSIVFLAGAGALQTLSLYRRIRTMNAELADSVARLRTSERRLMTQREELERDMAERTRELAEGKEQWERTFNAVSECIAILDRDLRILRVNRAFAESFRIAPEEAQGRSCCDFYPTERGLDDTCPSRKTLESGESQTVYFESAELDRIFSITTSPLLAADGAFLGAVHLARDVTEPRRMHQALQRAEEKYRTIFERSVEGIYQSTPDQGILEANPAMARLLGYDSPEQLIREAGDPVRQVYVEPGDREKLIRLLEEHGVVSDYETRFRRRDGSIVWVSISCRGVIGEDGKLRLFEGVVEDITDRKLTQLELEYRATFDALTGIPNRYLFSHSLSRMMAQARRQGSKFTLLFLDLDDFKLVNDRFGHDVGDVVLKEAAARIEKRLRKTDVLARMGGDEFTVLLHAVSEPRQIKRIVTDIMAAVAEPYRVDEITCEVSASIGVSVFPEDGGSEEELLKNADQAMYRAKTKGKSGRRAFIGKKRP